jgi:hypothetical protein
MRSIMADTMNWSWAGLLMLGAFHGVNPGMGWLFAVALGMQERRRAAVYQAMLPLALGHGLAIAAAVATAMLVGAVVPLRAIQWGVGGVLLVLGISRFFRHAHLRWVGMQVGPKDLTVWSFLMASAHGAGLMVLPLVVGASATPHHHMTHADASAWSALWATSIHTAGYLAVSAVIASVVFEKLGVGLLRKAWINLDLVWAISLVVTSVATVATA